MFTSRLFVFEAVPQFWFHPRLQSSPDFLAVGCVDALWESLNWILTLQSDSVHTGERQKNEEQKGYLQIKNVHCTSVFLNLYWSAWIAHLELHTTLYGLQLIAFYSGEQYIWNDLFMACSWWQQSQCEWTTEQGTARLDLDLCILISSQEAEGTLVKNLQKDQRWPRLT